MTSSAIRPSGPQGQRGYILLIVPVLLVGMSILGFQMASKAKTNVRIASSNLGYIQTTLCSQQCVSLAVNTVQKSLESSAPVPIGAMDCDCRTGEGPVYPCEADVGAPDTVVKTGCYGYFYRSTEVGIEASCEGNGGKSRSDLDVDVAYGEIPIFQFAVFFDGFLEMEPSWQDTHIRGKVHSNDTIRISPVGRLFLYDWITSPRAIVTMENPSGSADTRVLIQRKDGASIDQVNPDNAVDQLFGDIAPSWSAWKNDHRIAYANEPNGCQGVKPLTLPVHGLEDNAILIDWRSPDDNQSTKAQKYAWKADLIYRENAPSSGWRNENLAGVPVIPSPFVVPPPSPATPGNPSSAWATVVVNGKTRVTYWDIREQLNLRLLPIDVALLQLRSPTDSIIYLHDSLVVGGRIVGGFLLHNARRLIRPMTIVTNTRLVLLGDFNTDSTYIMPDGSRMHYPASLVSDNFTHLSRYFKPSQHTQALNDCGHSIINVVDPAYQMFLNACVMTGMTKVGGTQRDQGGYQNLIRYQEQLRLIPYHFTGSAVCMWNTRHTQAPFNDASHVYRAPARDFGFSPLFQDLRHMPPGTPRLVTPGLLNWEMVRE